MLRHCVNLPAGAASLLGEPVGLLGEPVGLLADLVLSQADAVSRTASTRTSVEAREAGMTKLSVRRGRSPEPTRRER